MPYKKINHHAVSIYYELHGDPQNPSLVLISGLKGDHSIWLPILDSLVQHYHVLIFDNRGVGRTSDNNTPFSIQTMADDTMALINALNLKQPNIVGHSLGGAIAQVIAKNYTDNIGKVVLCNTFSQLNLTAKKVFDNVLILHQQNATPAIIMDAIIPFAFSETFMTQEVRQTIHQVSNADPYTQSLENYARQWQALREFDSTPWLHSITLPTLIIGSKADQIATLTETQLLHEQITNSQLTVLPGGHAIMVEQPQRLVETILDFV